MDLAQDFNISVSRYLACLDFFNNVKSIYNFTTVDYESKILRLKEDAERIIS
jgi:hypothetical protein